MTAVQSEPSPITLVAPPPSARLDAVSRIAARVAAADSALDVFHAVHEEIASVLAPPVFLLALYDDASRMVEVVRQVDRGQELPGGSFPLGNGFTSRAIVERRHVLIREWSSDGPPIRVLYGTEQAELVKPESSLTVPMLVRERVLGVISVQSYVPNAFSEDDVPFLSAVASLAAAAIARVQSTTLGDPELARRTSELEAILANMTDALLIADASGAITRVNRAARELLALGPGPIVMGQPVLDGATSGRWPLATGLVPDVLRRMFERLREGEQVPEVEVELTTGPVRVVSFSGAALTAPDGSFGGAVIVFRDVTSRREIDRLKDEMLSTAWHDLRTPLTAIKGEAQLLRMRLVRTGDDRADLRRGLQIIDAQADRMHELVETLLDASGIQLGRLVLERVPTDLVAVVASVVEGISATSTGHDIRVEGPERCVGMWDGRRLRQVVENLVSNAVKYSPQGGVVSIAVRSDTDAATVLVADEGIGIDPSEAERIFERGYRSERALGHHGSGLGLYICEAIVTAHGGRMTCTSPGPGLGSTIGFTVPLAAQHA